MIIASKPKYIEEKKIDIYLKKYSNYQQLPKNNELYFNYGRSALLFFLQTYKDFYNKSLTIATQSLNCSVIMDACLQSKCKVILLDVKLNDFSISIDTLKTLSFDKNPDILILTHYQGVINQDYLKIANYCKENNILIIEDMSQTVKSTINNTEVGSLGNIQLHSFSFDKPFSSMKGGSLILNNINNEKFKHQLIKNYNKITTESLYVAKKDLEALKFLIHFSKPNNCLENIYERTMINFYFILGLPNSWIQALLKNKTLFFIAKIIFRIVCKIKQYFFYKITIKKLHPSKTNCILDQRKNFKYNNKIVQSLEKLLVKLNYKIPKFKNSNIFWNRYSFLDSNNSILPILKKHNIQGGTFNWPIPFHVQYIKNKNVIINATYPNTEYISKKIINLPIWTNCYLNIKVEN